MIIRAYVAADREACLAVFDTNVPRYFATHERVEFADFLDDLPGPYLVLVEDGAVVACGGWATGETETSTAGLCWGMVVRDRHRAGLGQRLLQARLDDIRGNVGIERVVLETSQHSEGFFSRSGFIVSARHPDGFARGIDRIEMFLRIGEAHDR